MEAFNNQTSHPAEPATTESGLRSPRWRRSEDQQTLSFSDVDRMNGRDETMKLPWYQRWWKAITGSLNFYRIHLLTFTFVSSGGNRRYMGVTWLKVNFTFATCTAPFNLGRHLPRLQHPVRTRLYRRPVRLRIQYDGHRSLDAQSEHPKWISTGHRLHEHVHRQPDLCQLDHDLGQEILFPERVRSYHRS